LPLSPLVSFFYCPSSPLAFPQFRVKTRFIDVLSSCHPCPFGPSLFLVIASLFFNLHLSPSPSYLSVRFLRFSTFPELQWIRLDCVVSVDIDAFAHLNMHLVEAPPQLSNSQTLVVRVLRQRLFPLLPIYTKISH